MTLSYLYIVCVVIGCGLCGVLRWTGETCFAASTHRRTFSARPRVGMCRQCPRPRATSVRHSGRVRATMRLMSYPNTREHERPDYTSRAAQSHVSEQSEQFSGVVGLIVVKLQVNYSQCRIGVIH
jgi:hypothetical protein